MSDLMLRRATPDDTPFIRSSWLKSYLGSGFAPKTSKAIYFQEFGAQIDRWMRYGDVKVACFESVPEEVLGYSILEGNVCRWVYVKAQYRRQHIGTALVQGAEWHSLETAHGRRLAAKVFSQFNPWR